MQAGSNAGAGCHSALQQTPNNQKDDGSAIAAHAIGALHSVITVAGRATKLSCITCAPSSSGVQTGQVPGPQSTAGNLPNWQTGLPTAVLQQSAPMYQYGQHSLNSRRQCGYQVSPVYHADGGPHHGLEGLFKLIVAHPAPATQAHIDSAWQSQRSS